MEIKERCINKLIKNGFKIIDEYKKDGKWNLVIIDGDGYKYDSRIDHLFKGFFPIVYQSNPYSLENISLWLYKNNKDFKLYMKNTYIGTKDKLKFQCLKCPEIFELSWNDVLGGGSCQFCRGYKVGKYNNLKYLLPELDKEWDKDNKLKSNEVTVGSGKSVWWICSKCGYRWLAKIEHRTIMKSGCPACNSSKGENKVELFLSKNYFFHIQEYSFKNCRNVFPLPFDFYLPDYNICIEYHGIQHYESVEFFGGEKELKELKKRDKIKLNYCKKNNIKLIIIPYWKFDDIESVLQKELRRINV